MNNFIARISEHTILATTFHFLHLELVKPDRIEFQAGQFISLLVDKNTNLRRSYSIASVPSMNHAIDLLVNISPGGSGSQYIQNLKPGDQVEFLGPMGSLIVQQFNNSTIQQYELLFVATGCGIAPVRSMILNQLVDKRNPNPIRLWWGMRYEEDCFWEEDFDLLEKEHPNFKWDLVLSQPPENWPLHQGHVTEYLFNYINSLRHTERGARLAESAKRALDESKYDQNNLSFYLCSDKQIVNEISTKLLETGISKEQIHFENFR